MASINETFSRKNKSDWKQGYDILNILKNKKGVKMNSKNPEVEKTLNSIMKAREALFKKEKERLLSDEAKHLQRAHVFDLDPEKDKDLILTGVFMVQNIMGLCINKLKLAPLESMSLTTYALMILGDCMGKGFKRVDIINQLLELDLL